MRARAVGGRAALLLAVLLACDIAPTKVAESPMLEAPLIAPSSADSPAGDETSPAASTADARGTTSAPEASPAESEGASPRLVLVTVDGVRWEDVFADATGEREPQKALMPSLTQLLRERGVALGGPGCPYDVRASGPNFVSLPGYLEMFTGQVSGCTHNGCAPVDTETVIDHARAMAERASDVAVFSSWSKYAHAVARGRKAIVLSAGAHGAVAAAKEDPKLKAYLEAGAEHAGYPGSGDYRPDVYTSRIALRYLETVRPRVLVVGLGDADEHAHRGDVSGYRRAVHRADDFVAEIDRMLARMGEAGRRTTVLVTTDHGRAHSLRGHGASHPESQRVFFAAFGAGVARRGEACAASPLRLAHLAGAMRSLLALESNGMPNPLADEIAGGR